MDNSSQTSPHIGNEKKQRSLAANKKTSQSLEDYLEAIYILENGGKEVRSIRVAEMLGFSRPAINQAMKELILLGLIEKPDYGKIALTKKGQDIAKETYSRHTAIKNFLISIGVSDEVAEIDSCKIEHIISPETLNAIKNQL